MNYIIVHYGYHGLSGYRFQRPTLETRALASDRSASPAPRWGGRGSAGFNELLKARLGLQESPDDKPLVPLFLQKGPDGEGGRDP